MRAIRIICLLLLALPFAAAGQPAVPTIDYIRTEIREPLAEDPAVIFYDDFEISQDLSVNYHDTGKTNFTVSDEAAFGGSEYALRQSYASGQVNGGWAWRFFGDHPSLPGTDKPSYDEIYVRWYHKFPEGFQGFPPKMARLGSFARSDWTLAFMVHYWIAGANSNVVADVAVNIPAGGSAPGLTGYNNFDHWLPVGRSSFSFSDDDNTGRWICHEMHVKVNEPGQADASYEYWADGRSIVRLSGRSLRENWSATSINAMQWDTYWNNGSPTSQSRYYDNLVISTQPIGPVMVSRNPTLQKTPYIGAGSQGGWHLQIAGDRFGNDIVWDSGEMTNGEIGVEATQESGTFTGTLEGSNRLGSGSIYFGRVRQQQNGGDWSAWSDWHSPFQTPPNLPAQIVSRFPDHSSIVLDPETDVTFSVVALDAEGDSLQYSWSVNGVAVVAETDSLGYTVTNAEQQTIAVTVNDGDNSETVSWRITIMMMGDLDQDDDVDFADFLVFAQAFGSADEASDFDASGQVDFEDFLTFVANFGRRRL